MRAPKASEQEHDAFAGQVRARMVDRVWFVGSNDVTAPQIEAGFQEMLGLLDDSSCDTPLSVRRHGRPSAISASGDSSTKCGPIRPPAP